jgi:tetratricopeptide (TPR) repeat protein
MTNRLRGLFTALLLLSLCRAGAAAQDSGAGARELIARGNERYARAEYEAAIKVYALVPAGAGDVYAQALYNIGVCRFELWQTEEAARMYARAVGARGGRYPKASYALGVALEELGRAAEAKASYARAAEGAGYAPAHYKLGMLAAGAGDTEGAASHFREAIRRAKGKFPASHNNLGVMLARAGRLAEAGREFEAALRHSEGTFEEAAHNLKLCRRLLAGRGGGDAAAALKVAAAADGFSR